MVTAIFTTLHQLPWIEYSILPIAVALIYLREKFQSNGLGVGIIILLAGIHIVFWNHILPEQGMSGYEKLAHALPFLVLSLSGINWSYIESINKYVKWPGIYLFALNTFIMVYFIFNSISPLIPAILWLALSLVALELSGFLRNRGIKTLEYKGEPDRYLLHIGYLLIFAFLVRHILVHLQIENYIGIFKTRFLIELYAISIFSYWATYKKPDKSKLYKSWIFLHPLFIELIVIFFIFTVSIEIAEFWHPIIWIALAFSCLYIGNKFSKELSRLRFYSLNI